jgi:hypothetical protein
VSNFLSHGPGIRKSIAFFENSQALPICPSDNSSIKTKMSVEHWRNDTEVLGEEPVKVPLCSTHISHGLAWNTNRAAAVRGRRLMAGSLAVHLNNIQTRSSSQQCHSDPVKIETNDCCSELRSGCIG